MNFQFFENKKKVKKTGENRRRQEWGAFKKKRWVTK